MSETIYWNLVFNFTETWRGFTLFYQHLKFSSIEMKWYVSDNNHVDIDNYHVDIDNYHVDIDNYGMQNHNILSAHLILVHWLLVH